MSLSSARFPEDVTPPAGRGPWSGAELAEWAGRSFLLTPGDPRLAKIHDGNSAASPPLQNLEGMVSAWEAHPEWLDFLDPNAPNHDEKRLERDLYLHWWAPWLPEGNARILDLGGGVGRFAMWGMDRGWDVELVDPDLRSLWRALSHAAGRAGRLDLHWSTGEALPDIAPVDAVFATEVLCYAEDPVRILEGLHRVLRPGGILFVSVEARYGWSAALDVAEGTLPALLGDGIVHVTGERWIRTYTQPEFRDLLSSRFEILRLVPTHYVLSGPFEAAWGGGDKESLLAAEAALRSHPATTEWNRAYTAVVRKPAR